MSKGLEALECSLKLYKMVESAGNDNGFNLNEAWEYHKIIKQALLELKAIKESNPNEALELVYCLKDYLMNMMPYYDWLNDIEKYILKTQEQEKKLKALEIIKTKNVDIFFLRNSCDRVEEYNEEINNNTMYYCYGNCRKLTQEEFDLLREVFKK